MPVPANLVHQTSTTGGTVAQTLVAVFGKRTFLAAFGTGGTNVFDYFISSRVAAEWERGTGHEASGTLVRDTVLENSLGTTALINFTAGTLDITNDINAAQQWWPFAAESDVASAGTTNIGAATTGKVRITGTTTITAFDTVAAGVRREGRFSGALTLTYNASSLILPGARSIVTAAGDTFVAYSLGSGNWIVTDYVRATGESVFPEYLFKNLSADATGGNVNTAQPWFPTAGGVTLRASTTYRFKGLLWLARTAGGVTSHTTAIGFGGTATLTSIVWDAICNTGDVSTNLAANKTSLAAVTSTVIKAASTSATEQIIVQVEGVVRVNATGTFIPQFTYSVAPGQAPTVKANSFFELIEIGSNSVTTSGTWS
jgi:hypothetical protein